MRQTAALIGRGLRPVSRLVLRALAACGAAIARVDIRRILASQLEYWLGSGRATNTGRGHASSVAGVLSGDDLIADLVATIELRQATLVTGARGCGKSYCVNKAVRAAESTGLIGQWRYLQGNSQIPRDYLLEDLLVPNGKGGLDLWPSVLFRSDNTSPRVQQLKTTYPLWPAIPGGAVTPTSDPRSLWEPEDWTALVLDEVNRFSDGFLDALLSLMEEKIAVRRGEDFFVPVVVLATANPPGYDLTAKRLSPPLQARIVRSYRVMQPPLEDLVHVILAARLKSQPPSASISVDLQYAAAGVTLCLWGTMEDTSRQCLAYLTADTQELIREAERVDEPLRAAMTEITNLSAFGPDARAIGDWILAAAALASKERRAQVDVTDLLRTVQAILPHKIRETYSEGLEPEKAVRLRRAVATVTDRVLTEPDLRELFDALLRAATSLGVGISDLSSQINLLPEYRRTTWRAALAALARESRSSQIDERAARAVLADTHAISERQMFVSEAEQEWWKQSAIRLNSLRHAQPLPLGDTWGVDPAAVLKEYQFSSPAVGTLVNDYFSEQLRRTDGEGDVNGVLMPLVLDFCEAILLKEPDDSAVAAFEQSLGVKRSRGGLTPADVRIAVNAALSCLLNLSETADQPYRDRARAVVLQTQ